VAPRLPSWVDGEPPTPFRRKLRPGRRCVLSEAGDNLCAMPRKSEFDAARLHQLLREQQAVISREQAFSCHMTRRTIDARVASSGPWQRLLPGVYLAVTGAVTPAQREMAALLYAGSASVLTGPVAVRRHRLRSPGPDAADVLIPWSHKRQSVGFVRVHRTRRMPERLFVTGQIRFAEVPRAVADTARLMNRFDDVRAVVCEAVQRDACTVAELTAELRAGPSAGSALFRRALAEIGDGVRSVAEADFRDLILASDLPRPVFNASLFGSDDTFIATVDAWWQEAGVAAEVDSRAYHLNARDQDRTTMRHDRLLTYGVLPLHFPPSRIRGDGPAVIGEIRQTIAQGRRRPPLRIKGLPAAA
jgi:hypothetical protein